MFYRALVTGPRSFRLLSPRWPGLHEQVRLLRDAVRWLAIALVIGALAGVSSWLFLEGLDRVTTFRVAHGWVVYLLPVAAAVIAAAYRSVGGRAAQGNALIIDAIHEPSIRVPRRMAPLIFGGALGAHLFGASVGREGVALQMSASLSENVARLLHLDEIDRRTLVIAALAAGFAAMFGVPIGATVFALEVQVVGRVRHEALLPALVAAVTGDLLVRELGWHHAAYPALHADVSASLLARVALAGLAFALAGVVFVELTDLVRGVLGRRVPVTVLRAAVGGAATVGLMALFGRDYLGLSTPLVDQAFAGHAGVGDSVLKVVFTAVALGSGIPGGEVTPLFVTGATLGCALAGPLGLPPATLAGIGLVAVFAGVANTPLACTVMAAELFSSGVLAAAAVACIVAYLFSGHRSIYATQRLAADEGGAVERAAPRDGWRTRRGDPPPDRS